MSRRCRTLGLTALAAAMSASGPQAVEAQSDRADRYDASSQATREGERIERPDFLPPDTPYPGLPRDIWYGAATRWRYRRYPGSYAPGWTPPSARYGYVDPYGYGQTGVPTDLVYDDAYRDGFRDGRRFEQFERSYELGRTSYLDAMEAGLAAFRDGDYGAAARHCLMATDLHNGDPISRLRAAHALVALGRYDTAVTHLRRALQLEPRVVFLPVDLRREYGRPQDFDEHLSKLRDAAETAKTDADLWLLLGYYQFFSDQREAALRSLSRASEFAERDRVLDRLLAAARASVAADERPSPERTHPRSDDARP